DPGGRDDGADLRRRRRAAAREPGGEAAEPVRRQRREEPGESAAAYSELRSAGAARTEMCLQGAPLVTVERPGREAAHRNAVEPVAEHEVLGEPVARGEQGLLHLGRDEPELGRGLVDAKAVQ